MSLKSPMLDAIYASVRVTYPQPTLGKQKFCVNIAAYASRLSIRPSDELIHKQGPDMDPLEIGEK